MTIVEELRTDRESGARRLESEYKAGLMSLARRFCADEGDAEELVNRTLAAVVEGIDDYLEQSAFFGWMCKILENLHAKDVRRKSSRTVVGDTVAVEGACDDDACDRIFREVDASLLRDAISDLPADMKESVVLRYFMDLPVAKIARFLALPEGTVMWRLHCARKILAAKLGAATRRPGARLVLLALLLAAGLAVGRGVYALASAALSSRAESAEVSASTASTVSTVPTVSTASTVPTVPTVSTVPTPDPSAMNPRFLLAATASLALVASPSEGATVDSTDFGKMIQFMVSGYAGSSTLEHFPVLVRLSTSIEGFDYADIGATAQAAAASLRFADADGNSLDYEIDTWDPAGESLVWVSVPEIAGTTTRFFAYFKPDAGATLPAVDPTAVWTRAGYFGVWHFGEVDATDGSVADATGNGLTAAPRALSGAPGLRTDGAGVVGAYVKSNAGLVLPSAAISAFADTRTDYTVEAWVNRSVENGGDQQIMRSANVWNQGAGLRLNDRIFYGNGGFTQWSEDYPVPLTGWTFLAGAFSTTQSGYLQLNDGYPLPSVTRGDSNTSFTAFSLTSRTGGTDDVFKGYADEFRLRRGLSSKDWSMAVYDSVRPGATFLHVDAVVTLDAAVVGLYGSATGTSFTATTIVGAFAAPDPTAYSATCSLTTNGVAVRAGLAAGTLGADGLVSVALDDLVPGTEYEFVFTVSLGDADVYSAGSFTTAALPAPTVSGVGETTATASLAATLAGPSYAAGTVTAVFSPVLNGATVALPASFADGAWTATATTLEADQDYAVSFVVAPSGAPSFASPSSAPFVTPGTARVSNTAFRWQMSVTATGYDGTETLEHFPVLVRVPAAIAATVPDPSGIRFALENGKLLPHEIEWWDPSGLSAIWVSVPSLSGTDTSFYMLWDPVPGAAVHGSLSPARIWTAAGYVGVWHFAAQNADGAYPDASGHGATAISIDATKMPNAPETATLSTNGTPWHVANIGLKVAPANTADWTFSSTGYTTEAWLIPTSGYNRMFLYANGNNDGNTMAFSTSQVYVMNWNYDQSSWPNGLGASAWRFITTAWRHADADWTTRFYANAEQRSSWGSKNAADFTDHGMGLTSGTEGNGVMNYSVDELRVRRGNSTADWVQANYDTQVLGSDFLTYGRQERTQRATLILVM